MVKAPHFERADLLVRIIRQAMYITSEPIDEVTLGDGNAIRVRAGSIELTGRYGVAPRADAMPGPIDWVVEFDPVPT